VPLRHREGDKDHLTRLAALSLGAYSMGKKDLGAITMGLVTIALVVPAYARDLRLRLLRTLAAPDNLGQPGYAP
jgi:hypothetical protein